MYAKNGFCIHVLNLSSDADTTEQTSIEDDHSSNPKDRAVRPELEGNKSNTSVIKSLPESSDYGIIAKEAVPSYKDSTMNTTEIIQKNYFLTSNNTKCMEESAVLDRRAAEALPESLEAFPSGIGDMLESEKIDSREELLEARSFAQENISISVLDAVNLASNATEAKQSLESCSLDQNASQASIKLEDLDGNANKVMISDEIVYSSTTEVIARCDSSVSSPIDPSHEVNNFVQSTIEASVSDTGTVSNAAECVAQEFDKDLACSGVKKLSISSKEKRNKRRSIEDVIKSLSFHGGYFIVSM